MLAQATAGGKKVGWKNATATARSNLQRWQAGAEAYAGVHLFLRYFGEDDLLVASLRRDGYLMIKTKTRGAYSPALVSRYVGVPKLGTWYTLSFSASGTTLVATVSSSAGTFRITTTSNARAWGTSGIRTDACDVYVDDWHVN
jgi:hypothetical protein